MVFRNRKAQGEEIGMGIAALGFIVLLGIVSFFYFVVLRGNVARESSAPFAEREHVLSTTSYLSNLMGTRDAYGVKYSSLIQMAVSSPDALHPSKETYSAYLGSNVSPNICKWLDDNLGKFTHYFFVDVEGINKFECGVKPQEEVTFSETQTLPIEGDKKIRVVLVTWPS